MQHAKHCSSRTNSAEPESIAVLPIWLKIDATTSPTEKTFEHDNQEFDLHGDSYYSYPSGWRRPGWPLGMAGARTQHQSVNSLF
jgi:hypothetical protein